LRKDALSASFASMRVVWDTKSTSIPKRVIDKRLLEMEKATYFLHIETLLME
jgi:hypothetical protein